MMRSENYKKNFLNKTEAVQKIAEIIYDKSTVSPRFERHVLHVGESEDYAQNFGLQWESFSKIQYDSNLKTTLTGTRFAESSGWDLQLMKDKLVLEIGSGAGRFTEILRQLGGTLVSIDLSTAIYVNQRQNEDPNILFIRCSLYDLTMLTDVFDYVICYGVIQHTPDPIKAYRVICSCAKRGGGRITTDQYIKRWYPTPYYHPKYLWRPLTTRMSPQLLLKIVRLYIPIYLKFDTTIIKYLPKYLSYFLRGIIPIPCWNYYSVKSIPQDNTTLEQLAILDTFDALGAKYDEPASVRDIHKWVKGLDLVSYTVRSGGNGVLFNAMK